MTKSRYVKAVFPLGPGETKKIRIVKKIPVGASGIKHVIISREGKACKHDLTYNANEPK